MHRKYSLRRSPPGPPFVFASASPPDAEPQRIRRRRPCPNPRQRNVCGRPVSPRLGGALETADHAGAYGRCRWPRHHIPSGVPPCLERAKILPPGNVCTLELLLPITLTAALSNPGLRREDNISGIVGLVGSRAEGGHSLGGFPKFSRNWEGKHRCAKSASEEEESFFISFLMKRSRRDS